MLLATKLLVAFDAGALAGALVSGGLRGPRIRALAGVGLAEGALTPSPVDPNLTRPSEVRDALRELVRRLEAAGRPACLLLPDGVARMLLLEKAPPGDGLDFARFRLAQALPYPAAEAVVDVLRMGRGRSVAAAVRRRVAADYEAAAAEAGLVQERLELAPLAALAALGRAPLSGVSVDVILGDAALSLAVFENGVLRALRNRRRAPGEGEAERLRAEVDRTATLAGAAGGPSRVRVVGAGAAALIRSLSSLGRAAEPGWRLPGDGLGVDAAELSWLGAMLG